MVLAVTEQHRGGAHLPLLVLFVGTRAADLQRSLFRASSLLVLALSPQPLQCVEILPEPLLPTHTVPGFSWPRQGPTLGDGSHLRSRGFSSFMGSSPMRICSSPGLSS